MARIQIKKVLQSSAVFLSIFCFEKTGFSQNRKWVWKQIGDEISNYLVMGNGSIKDDMGHFTIASTSHLSTFSPTYVAAALIEAALIPFEWTFQQTKAGSVHVSQSTEASSAKSYEDENTELKKELEQTRERAREREAELNKKIQELLKDQAEKYIDTYNSKIGRGEMGPELKKYLHETRIRIFSTYSSLGLALGVPSPDIKTSIFKIDRNISDLKLIHFFLVSQGDAT